MNDEFSEHRSSLIVHHSSFITHRSSLIVHHSSFSSLYLPKPLSPTISEKEDMQPMVIDTGNTGFMILCASLVMLMTPGLAFFYGGLVGRKNVLTIMMQSFVSMGWT